ncbi:uncharacterized protein LOC121291904 [Carcharodon carcharias]|uniref:uncharacterized protein LOC121291904 n=1 Tax=Carcharodon carcharias TaxID=13397 RepID=UPI001B7E0164|nr:uncharacterized protein LOC121291904 [Carcharodon carcharias]
MGCCWSDLFGDPSSATPQSIVYSVGRSHPPGSAHGHYRNVASEEESEEEEEEEEEGSGYGHVEESSKDDERQFFLTFLTVLDRRQPYHGTLQRWKNEVHWAGEEGSHILRWDYIWREDGVGYLRTLDRVSQLAELNQFTTADLGRLVFLAKRVVKQRKGEYYHARSLGRANWRHEKCRAVHDQVLKTGTFQGPGLHAEGRIKAWGSCHRGPMRKGHCLRSFSHSVPRGWELYRPLGLYDSH